jgi:hypothetical protein
MLPRRLPLRGQWARMGSGSSLRVELLHEREEQELGQLRGCQRAALLSFLLSRRLQRCRILLGSLRS